MTFFFTSDLHFGHVNIIDYCDRPFSDVDDMNDALVQRWNWMVGPADTVFVLGDVAMGKLDDSLKHVERLNGDKYLIPGNHDRCWLGNAKEGRDIRPKDIQRYIDVGFTILGSSDRLHGVFDVPVELCHFPFSGDSREEDRYRMWRPIDHGQILLHGHTHSKEHANGRQIHVGVDAWNYYPVHQDTIADIIHDINLGVYE